MRNSVTNKLHTCKTLLPFVSAQNTLRVAIILGIVYSHEIVFTQPMTSDTVFCGIN
jgi:hypothetical protein